MLDGFATDAQRTRWLDPLLAGEIPANIATTVRREGDEHVVSGRKYFITNAPPDERCRLFLIMARLPQQPPRRTPSSRQIVKPDRTPTTPQTPSG